MSDTKKLSRISHSAGYEQKRDIAQAMTFDQLQELVQRNVASSLNKTYTQYTKDSVRTYLENPANSLSRIIEISRFLERNSSLYKKILMYYASYPKFYYNLTQENDITKSINVNKSKKDFMTVAKTVHGFNLAKEFYTAIYSCIRDGMYVGFTYGDDEHTFFMPLDVSYCRIKGKNSAGEWNVYFDASFFSQGNNSVFIEGSDGSGADAWDQVFIDGFNAYQQDRNVRWFLLPPERTFALIAGSDDQFDVPLPFFAPLFISLMDLQDQEAIIAARTELQNYKLLVSKIPLLESSDDVDDFAISLKLANQFNALLLNAVPDLVAAVTSPMDLEVVDFNKSNTTEETNELSNSMQNFFNNAGVSQLVVSGGVSTNSVGLKHAIENDMSNVWVYVNRIESWLNYYIKANISEGYVLSIHKVSWYNEDDYVKQKKDLACTGASKMDLVTACGCTPYQAFQQLTWEIAMDINSLFVPLSTSYTMTDNDGTKPKKDDDDLSGEGLATRDGDKNGSENN